MRRLVFFPFPKGLAKLLLTLISTTEILIREGSILSGKSPLYHTIGEALIRCLRTFQWSSRQNTKSFIAPEKLFTPSFSSPGLFF